MASLATLSGRSRAGRFFLLQARPITVADPAERERVRREVIHDLIVPGRSEGDGLGAV